MQKKKKYKEGEDNDSKFIDEKELSDIGPIIGLLKFHILF